MPSKRSFFNRTLFRKNLSRSWPLWGALSLAGAMIPLYILLELMQRYTLAPDHLDFAAGLYEAVTMFAPAFTAAYAILCAMLVWGYLYNPRSIGLFHALPVDRTCLFVTNTLSGLTMIAIPYAVTGGLICLLALCWGFFDFFAVVNTVLAVILLAVTFFALATLCAMLTGHIFMLPALYVLANFLAPMLEGLISSLAEQFLLGIGEERGMFIFLAPLFEIYSRFTVYNRPIGVTTTPSGYERELTEPVLSGLWVVALYALAGLAMLALAWFLYKKRHSECAGDVVAFRWMRPVFRYGLALLSGLTLGRVLYELLWRELFQRGNYGDVLPMFVCMALTGVIGYYAASMLIEKSKRVFRGSLKGVAIVCAGAAVLMLLVSVDVLGIERRVPAPEEIDSVILMDRGISSGFFEMDKNPEQAEMIRAFHQAVVNDRDYIRAYSPDWHEDEGRVFSHYVRVTYCLKDGSTLERAYDLWFSADRAVQEGTYENRLAAFYQDGEVRRRSVTIPENAGINGIDILCDYTDGYSVNTNDTNPEDTKTIYAALLQDADEGNIPAMDILSYYSTKSSTLWLNLEYRTFRDGGWNYSYKDVYLHPQMVNTVNALLELGYLTENEVNLWREDFGTDDEIAARAGALVP